MVIIKTEMIIKFNNGLKVPHKKLWLQDEGQVLMSGESNKVHPYTGRECRMEELTETRIEEFTVR